MHYNTQEKECHRFPKFLASARFENPNTPFILDLTSLSLNLIVTAYLEQIHVFVFAKVKANDLDALKLELGSLFSPFPSILYTESASHRLLVFKEDGSPWALSDSKPESFKEFVRLNTKPLTVISLSQIPSLADSTTGFSQAV